MNPIRVQLCYVATTNKLFQSMMDEKSETLLGEMLPRDSTRNTDSVRHDPVNSFAMTQFAERRHGHYHFYRASAHCRALLI